MKRTKKIALIIATVALMAVCFVFGASAERTIVASGNCGADGDNIKWELYDNGDLVFVGEGDMWDYKRKPHETTAPTKPKDESSPWISMNVKRVLFSDKITHIGNYSFDKMKTIEEVKFPTALNSIGTSAFNECINLKELNFPEELTVIGSSAFCGIDSLIKIDFPENLQEIGSFAFCRSMKNIKSIRIPENAKKIGGSAFYSYDTDALESIIIESRFEVSDYTRIFPSCPSKCSIYIVYSEEELYSFIRQYNLESVFGNAKVYFDYNKNTIPIAVCEISGISDQEYDGYIDEQPILIVDKERNYTLKKGIDYIVHYEGVQYGNIASLIVEGVGCYSTSISYEYKIIPKIILSNTTNGVKVKWYFLDNNEATNYQVYRKEENGSFKVCLAKYKYDSDKETIYLIDKDAKENGKKYTYKVVASYYTIGSEQDSYESNKKFIFKINAPIGVVIKKGYKALTINYDKNTKATGYEIYRSATKNGTYKKIKTTTSTSYKNSNLTIGDKHYYKVRAYYVVKGIKYYSAFSKVVGATVPSATLNYTKKTLYKGEILTVKLLYTKDAKGLKWSSSDTNVATISSKGKITAKNYGSCYIYAKYNGKTYSCKITVKRIVPKNIIVVYNGYVTRDNYFIVRFDNEEKKPITIYSSGAYSQDFDYAYYDRNLKLYNGKSSITIKPGESQYIYFKVVGSQTWPIDDDHTIYFKMYLDEKTYWVRTNKNGFEVKMNGVWTELY